MLIKTKISSEFDGLEIQVCHHENTDEVQETVLALQQFFDKQYLGYDAKGAAGILRANNILCFYAAGTKVYAKTGTKEYVVEKKLYALEEELANNNFVRISKSEIVNIRHIRKVDMNIAGTIKVILSDGSETYASRRNVTKLKTALRSHLKKGESV